MLLRVDFVEGQRFSFVNQRQRALVFFVFGRLFVAALLINLEEAVKLLDRSGSPKDKAAGSYVDSGLVKNGRSHLRRDKPLPNEPIKFQFFRLQILRQ